MEHTGHSGEVPDKDVIIEALGEQNRALKEEVKVMSEELEARRKEIKLSDGELEKLIRSLSKSEEKYRRLFESMNEAMALLRLIYDDSGQVVDYTFLEVNQSYEAIMGTDRAERVGRTASECYGQAGHLEIYGRVAATGKPARFHSYSPYMEKHFSVSAFSPGKGEVAIVFSDITDRRQTEEVSRALSEISMAINSAPKVILAMNTILSIARNVLGADFGTMYIRNGDRWVLQHTYGLDAEKLKGTCASVGEARVIELVASENKPLAIVDVLNDERVKAHAMNIADIRSVMAAPIMLNNNAIGVIGFYYGKPLKRFTWAQLYFADRLSSMLSLALANSQLYESLQQKLVERKKLEESLRDIALNAQMRAAVLETTIASIGEGVIIYGKKGEIVRMNEYARNLLGYTQEDTGLPIDDRVRKTRLFSPEGILQKPEDHPVYRSIRGEVFLNLDFLLINCNSDNIWISVSAAPLKDETGILFGAVITLNDITERKKAEEVLKLNEARLEALVKLNDMAGAPEEELFDFALESALSITESRFGEIFTVNLDGTTGTIRSIVKDAIPGLRSPCKSRHQARYSDLMEEIFSTRRPIVINDYDTWQNSKKRLPDGHIKITRILEVPVIENDHIVAICLVANKATNYMEDDAWQLSLMMNDVWRITARKQAEKELLEAKKQAELYLDLMGHDISNIHQIAIGYLELAGELQGHDMRDSSVLDKPLEALQRSAQLIDNVRKLQKIRAGEINLKSIDLDEIFGLVIEAYRGYTISYTTVCGEKPYYVMANELLYDVFSNIVGNAVKHSGRKDVNISITIDIARVSDKSYYKIYVDDDGPGISDYMKEKIFNRMQQGDTGAKGMGLGLHLVKSLVESYQGWVRVEDRLPGDYARGSRFVIILPMLEH